MTNDAMRALVSSYLKDDYSDDEYSEAEWYARMKLDYQNILFGTQHGEDYLAILIAETISGNRFYNELDAKYTSKAHENEQEALNEKTAKSLGVTLAEAEFVIDVFRNAGLLNDMIDAFSTPIVPQASHKYNMEVVNYG